MSSLWPSSATNWNALVLQQRCSVYYKCWWSFDLSNLFLFSVYLGRRWICAWNPYSDREKLPWKAKKKKNSISLQDTPNRQISLLPMESHQLDECESECKRKGKTPFTAPCINNDKSFTPHSLLLFSTTDTHDKDVFRQLCLCKCYESQYMHIIIQLLCKELHYSTALIYNILLLRCLPLRLHSIWPLIVAQTLLLFTVCLLYLWSYMPIAFHSTVNPEEHLNILFVLSISVLRKFTWLLCFRMDN